MAVTILRASLAFVAFASLAACATEGVAPVSNDVPRGDFVLRASGQGDWRVECTIDTVRGRSAVAEIDGKGRTNYDVIAIEGAIAGSCSYEAGDADLILTAESSGIACPFEVGAEELCRAMIPAGMTDSFTISLQ